MVAVVKLGHKSRGCGKTRSRLDFNVGHVSQDIDIE